MSKVSKPSSAGTRLECRDTVLGHVSTTFGPSRHAHWRYGQIVRDVVKGSVYIAYYLEFLVFPGVQTGPQYNRSLERERKSEEVAFNNCGLCLAHRGVPF